MSTEVNNASNVPDLSGKYLTFKLDNEAYAIPILKVREILGVLPITKIPRAPGFVRGVVNLRGKVIPIVDLRLKFHLEPREDTENTCIIVVRVQGDRAPLTLGVIVDEVSEVLNIEAEQIERAPSLGTNADTDFLLGLGKAGKHVLMLLDVDRALFCIEVEESSLTEAMSQAPFNGLILEEG